MTRRIAFALLLLAGCASTDSVSTPVKPNVVFILTDDMGYGDLSCYGNPEISTPNIDRLAREGIRFTRYYSASPICSPSRTAILTGSFPARWKIASYLQTRQGNRSSGQADFLDPAAPSLARAFKQAGYATAHFGKWHLGGGRDVDDAPLPSAYGFDEHLVNVEGLGPRFPAFRSTYAISTESVVDKAIDFLKRNRSGPFFLNLWPTVVHTPHDADPADLAKHAAFSNQPPKQKFYSVLDGYDRQIGRLLDAIRELGLDEKTMIVFTSDNGPQPGFAPRTGGLRGMKWSLYEGGLRMPCIVRWKGTVPAGRVNETTVLAAVDWLPMLVRAAGDGEDLSAALRGESPVRTKPLFWEYGRSWPRSNPAPPADMKSPTLAVREGKWKLLVNGDGSDCQLYDLDSDPNESANRADRDASVAASLSGRLLAWFRSVE